MRSNQALHWFTAVLVLRSRVGEGFHDDPLLDHQVRLIQARDAEAAYARARVLGEGEAQTYRNSVGELVTWEFAGLADLAQLLASDISDGTEVYSWQTRGESKASVLPKEELAAFWSQASAHRITKELLG